MRFKKCIIISIFKIRLSEHPGYKEIVTDTVKDEDIFSNFRNNQEYKEILSYVLQPLTENIIKNKNRR
jgi:hypothetical protein